MKKGKGNWRVVIMRVSGRRATPLSEEQLKIVKEYLESNLTYSEVAEKYNVKINSLKYWVARYRKEINNNGQTNKVD